MTKYKIIEVSYSQKQYMVEANDKQEASDMHQAGESKFVYEGGCLDGEIVNTEIDEIVR